MCPACSHAPDSKPVLAASPVPHMAGERCMRKRKPFWHPVLGKLRKIHTKWALAHPVGNKSSTWPKAECLCCRASGGSGCMRAAKLALNHPVPGWAGSGSAQPTAVLLVVFTNTPGLWTSCCQPPWSNPQPPGGGQTQLSTAQSHCVSGYQTIWVLQNFDNNSD